MAAQLRGGGGCNLEEGIDISHSWDVLWNEGFELGVQLCSLWGVAAYVLKQLLQLFAHLEMIILTRVISPEILNTSHELGESIPESTYRGTCGPPSPSPPNSPRQGHMWSTLPLPSQLTQTGAHVVYPPPPLPTHPDRGTCGPPSPSPPNSPRQGHMWSTLPLTGHMWSTPPLPTHPDRAHVVHSPLSIYPDRGTRASGPPSPSISIHPESGTHGPPSPSQLTQTGAHVQVVHPPPPFQFTQTGAHMVHSPPPSLPKSPRQGHTCKWSTLPLPSNPDRGTHGPPSSSLPNSPRLGHSPRQGHPPALYPLHSPGQGHTWSTLPSLPTHPDRGLPSQLTQTGAPSPSQLT